MVLSKALYQEGRGADPYRPLFSVLYSRGGRLGTVPCASFFTGGDDSLLSPVFGFVEQGGRLSTLCSVLHRTGGGQLSTVSCVLVYVEFSTAFGGGDDVIYSQ